MREWSRMRARNRQAEGRARVLAEADDVLDAAPRARACSRSFESGIVAVEERRAAGLQPLENLGLGLGDFVEIPEEAEMAGAISVTMATCGRTIFTSGRISPGWFMPISNTA